MHNWHYPLFATYNAWMNKKVYEACTRLSSDQLRQDRKAFFGSIFGTLNHIAVADTIWLKRFKAHLPVFPEFESFDRIAKPTRLDQILFDDFQGLTAYRGGLDQLICTLAETVTEEDLGSVMPYTNVEGVDSARRFSALLLHFFNHQTHHRGQAIDLLHQAGIDVGTTDLLELIPDER